MLDVGTGTGRAAIALAKRGAMVTGVDASAEMLARRAAARAADAGVDGVPSRAATRIASSLPIAASTRSCACAC